jgi:hypothetical protein
MFIDSLNMIQFAKQSIYLSEGLPQLLISLSLSQLLFFESLIIPVLQLSYLLLELPVVSLPMFVFEHLILQSDDQLVLMVDSLYIEGKKAWKITW